MRSRRALNQHERRVVAFHEAGHALVGELLPGVDRPHRVSIVPRGTALGFAMSLPEEDRYLKTRQELVDRIAVLLAGRAAEQIVFGEVTTGAANDLQNVAEITYAMVHHYAMGSASTPQRAVLDVDAVVGHHAPHPRRGAARAGLRGPRDRAVAARVAPRASSTSSPRRCSSSSRSTAATSIASSARSASCASPPPPPRSAAATGA